MTLMAVVFAIAADAQYNVGTSSRYTDSYGNSTSTHRNQYGQTTGTSSSYTDSYGNTMGKQSEHQQPILIVMGIPLLPTRISMDRR